ncbi:MAG TPA: ankyrin repeat domain-containing protein [Bryobacteraceae bacterium]|nr:ankyrin repeat domain-containing protein [Bryobacteraceae bacterium]
MSQTQNRFEALPFDAPLADYEKEAAEAGALAAAGRYAFANWEALAGYVDAVRQPGSPVFRFESAVEAVIHGDAGALDRLLREDPALPAARSLRGHHATLLHYVAANGVEQYRQKSPSNAAAVAKMLIERGADVNALADMYGGRCTTLEMLVSSTPPAEAGVQVPVVEVLLDSGAKVEGALITALAFGHRDAAEALARRGAHADNLAAAAGLGRLAELAHWLPQADGETRHRALALAAQHGYAEIVRLLLDAGEDPSRYNPPGFHGHSTPLHQAALAGHGEVVRLLVERGARLDLRDKMYNGTALDWAAYAGRDGIRDYLARQQPGVA